MTTRGATTEDFVQIAEFVRRGVDIAAERKREMTDAGTKKLAAYKASLATEPPAAIESLRSEVCVIGRASVRWRAWLNLCLASGRGVCTSVPDCGVCRRGYALPVMSHK